MTGSSRAKAFTSVWHRDRGERAGLGSFRSIRLPLFGVVQKAMQDMYKKRRIERHQLPYFLKVFNGVNDRPIGFLGNVSEDGLMLISHLPLMVGADFDLHLKIPADEGGQLNIRLKASCLWCHEDVTPQHFDAGFSLQWVPPEYGQLVSALQQYFSFHTLPASA